MPTSGGVCRVQGDSCVPLAPFDSPVWQYGPTALDARGRLWHATALSGLYVIEEREGSYSWFQPEGGEQLKSGIVRTITLAPDGGIWLGTADRGLVHFEGDGAVVLPDSMRLSGHAIRHVYPDREGYLWVGTDSDGLCRIAATRTAGRGAPSDSRQCLNSRQGLPGDSVNAVLEDSLGRLWISGQRGITVASRASVEDVLDGATQGILSLTLGKAHGMLDGETNGFAQPAVAVDAAGVFWFATQDGLATVEPSGFLSPMSPVPELETPAAALRASGETGFWSFLSLGSADRDLTIRWAVADLAWANAVRYRYRLVGVDRAWSKPTRELTATWSDLPPGRFTLEVQAGILEWSPTVGVEVEFLPTFTETLYFPAMVVLGLALGTLLVMLWRTRISRTRERRLEETVAQHTVELSRRGKALELQIARMVELDRVRRRFVANASLQLHPPLTLLQGHLDEIGTLLSQGRRARIAAAVDAANGSLGELDTVVKQLLDLARIDSGEVKLELRTGDFGLFLQQEVRRFAEEALERQVAVEYRGPGGHCSLPFDAHVVGKVLANLLGGVLWAASPGAQIMVRLVAAGTESPEESLVSVRVEVDLSPTNSGATALLEDSDYGDAAMGADEAVGLRVVRLGVALARELVRLHGGRYGMMSMPGHGTTAWFTISDRTSERWFGSVAAARRGYSPGASLVEAPELAAGTEPPATGPSPAHGVHFAEEMQTADPAEAAPLEAIADAEFMYRVEVIMAQNLGIREFGVGDLARAVGLSPRQLQRRLGELTGQSPRGLLRSVRMRAAREALRRGRFKTIAEVAAFVGMTPNYFTRAYRKRYGHVPMDDMHGYAR